MSRTKTFGALAVLGLLMTGGVSPAFAAEAGEASAAAAEGGNSPPSPWWVGDVYIGGSPNFAEPQPSAIAVAPQPAPVQVAATAPGRG